MMLWWFNFLIECWVEIQWFYFPGIEVIEKKIFFLCLEEGSFLFQYLFCGNFMEETQKKGWYVPGSRVHLILTNTVLLSISSLIHVLLCKVRSPSRVAKMRLLGPYTGVSWKHTQIEVCYRYIYHSLMFVCIYIRVVGHIQYPLVWEGEDGTLLKVCAFCMFCEVCLQSVQHYFQAGHPQALFHLSVSKNSAQRTISDL